MCWTGKNKKTESGHHKHIFACFWFFSNSKHLLFYSWIVFLSPTCLFVRIRPLIVCQTDTGLSGSLFVPCLCVFHWNVCLSLESSGVISFCFISRLISSTSLAFQCVLSAFAPKISKTWRLSLVSLNKTQTIIIISRRHANFIVCREIHYQSGANRKKQKSPILPVRTACINVQSKQNGKRVVHAVAILLACGCARHY